MPELARIWRVLDRDAAAGPLQYERATGGELCRRCEPICRSPHEGM